jgi:hypothetical protein
LQELKIKVIKLTQTRATPLHDGYQAINGGIGSSINIGK